MDVASLLIKQVTQGLSPAEQDLFDKWVASSENNRELYKLLRDKYQMGEALPSVEQIKTLDVDLAWKQVRQKHIKKSRPKYISVLSKVAAVAILLLGTGYFYLLHSKNSVDESIPANAITLDLGNGNIQVISPENQRTIANGKGQVLGVQNGGVLDYSKAKKKDRYTKKELAYNELKVPYGQQFTLVLSDGTTVHLNAGSSLNYPVHFSEEGNRAVTLIGEGYFEVHKDPTRPFIVTAGDMNVRVLGTKFNLSAYPEDKKINTVLVEGSVGLYGSEETYDKEHPTLLQPGYKAAWSRDVRNISFEKVDTDIYTGWIDGKLVLKKMPFQNILEKLQRHYKVTITNTYAKLDNQVFTATFENETIGEVLESFKEDTPFEYHIEGEHITITEPKNQTPMK